MEPTTILEYYEGYEYCYDRENKNLLVRYSEDGTLEKYVYGNGLIASSETRESHSPKYRTYLYDLRGSVTFTLDSSANITSEYRYSTYGKRNVIKGSTTSELGYCARDGVLTEVTGLLYMRARYYYPNLMRFINQDIVTGDISNSNSLNRYTYVEGNPATMIDPFGLCAENTIKGGIKKTVKGVGQLGMAGAAAYGGITIAGISGPIGWLGLGIVLISGVVANFGLSDAEEGIDEIKKAINGDDFPSYNFVRDEYFHGNKKFYRSVDESTYGLMLILVMAKERAGGFDRRNPMDVSSEASNQYKGTRNPQNDFLNRQGNSTLEDHASRHSNLSSEEYLNAARNFMEKVPTNTTESFVSKGGAYFRYDTATNEFGIINQYGGISTYFYPDEGITYWLQQIELYAIK